MIKIIPVENLRSAALLRKHMLATTKTRALALFKISKNTSTMNSFLLEQMVCNIPVDGVPGARVYVVASARGTRMILAPLVDYDTDIRLDIPLIDDQEFEAEFIVVEGCATDHAKYSAFTSIGVDEEKMCLVVTTQRKSVAKTL